MLPFPSCLKPWIAALANPSLPNSVQGFGPEAVRATSSKPTLDESANSTEAPPPQWKWQLFLQDRDSIPAKPCPRIPALVLWFASQNEVWISLPLGHDPQSPSGETHSSRSTALNSTAQDPNSQGHAEKDRSVLQGLCHEQAEWWPRLDALDSCPRAFLHAWQSERDELRAALLQSQCLSVDGIRWIVVPCHRWSLMAQVLASHSPPPPSVVLDWTAQWLRASPTPRNPSASHPPSGPAPQVQRLPNSPIHTMVSKSGLICSLEAFLMALIDSLQLDPEPAHALAWVDQQQLRGTVSTWPRLSTSQQGADPLLDSSDEIDAKVPAEASPIASPSNASTTHRAHPLRTASPSPVRTMPHAGMQSKKPSSNRSSKRKRGWNPWVWLAAALPLLLLIWLWLWPDSTSPTDSPDPLVKTSPQSPNATTPPSTPSSATNASAADASLALESTPSDAMTENELTRSDGLMRIEAGSPESSSEAAMPTLAGMLENMESQIETMRRAAVDSQGTTAIESPQALTADWQDPTPTLENPSLTTDSIVEQTLSQSLGAPAFDPRNESPIPSTTIQTPKPVDEPSRQFAVDPLEWSNPSGKVGDTTEPVGDATSLDAPDALSTLDQLFPVRRAVTRSDVKIGRNASLQHSSVEATLELNDEAISEIQVIPEASLRLDGPGKMEWRIALEDAEPELIVRLTSKPGPKWQFATQVGVQLEPSQPPILLGPDDSQSILRNLGVYEQWLRQSIDSLSHSPAHPRAPNRGDPINQLRMLRAQLKECEKALKRWKEVQKISSELFGYGSIRLRLEPQTVTTKATATSPDP